MLYTKIGEVINNIVLGGLTLWLLMLPTIRKKIKKLQIPYPNLFKKLERFIQKSDTIIRVCCIVGFILSTIFLIKGCSVEVNQQE